MEIPRVKIQYLNGQLGTVGDSPDGLFALVCGATAVAATFELGKAYTLRNVEELTALGVTAENNPRLTKHVTDFYAEAEDGTKLIIYGVDKTTTMTAMLDKDTGSVKALITGQNGALRGLFVACEGLTTGDVTEGLDPDVLTAIPKAQDLAEWATTELYAPLFIVLEGRHFEKDAVKQIGDGTSNRVAVLVGDTESGSEGACVGTLAGRLATIGVQRNIGRVKDGELAPLVMYIGTQKVEEAGSAVADLYDKGYITPRKHVGRTGYYFTDDRMACKATDDYAHLTARRTVDKAYRIAYDTMLSLLLDELEVNDDGTLQAGVVKSWQQSVTNAIDTNMTAAGELSATSDGEGCVCYIDEKQNVVSTSKVTVTLKVRPFGYARYVDVNLGFQLTTS